MHLARFTTLLLFSLSAQAGTLIISENGHPVTFDNPCSFLTTCDSHVDYTTPDGAITVSASSTAQDGNSPAETVSYTVTNNTGIFADLDLIYLQSYGLPGDYSQMLAAFETSGNCTTPYGRINYIAYVGRSEMDPTVQGCNIGPYERSVTQFTPVDTSLEIDLPVTFHFGIEHSAGDPLFTTPTTSTITFTITAQPMMPGTYFATDTPEAGTLLVTGFCLLALYGGRTRQASSPDERRGKP